MINSVIADLNDDIWIVDNFYLPETLTNVIILKATDNSILENVSQDTLTIVYKEDYVDTTNHAPVFTVSSGELKDTVKTGITYEKILRAIDQDANDSMWFEASTGLTLSVDTIRWTPQVSDTGVNYFYALVKDRKLAKDSIDWTVTVLDTGSNVPNTPPDFITKVSDILCNVVKNDLYLDTLEAQDIDEDSLTFFKISGPTDLSIGPQNGVISWTPSDTGKFNVIARVVDDSAAYDEIAWTITVLPDSIPQNNPPQFVTDSSDMKDSIILGQIYKDTVEAIDPDAGDNIMYSIINGPVSIDSITGIVTWTPVSEDKVNITVRALDDSSAYDDLTWSITVIDTTTPQGLVAYYPFTGNANDSSGYENHGVENGGVSLTIDRFGNINSAYYFDGIDDYIEATDNNLPLDSCSRSISFWINNISDTIDNETMICYGINNHGELFQIQIQKEQQTFRKISVGLHDNDYYSDSLVPTNKWMHVAVTIDDYLNYKIYLNSEVVGNGIINQPFNTKSNGILRFGKRSVPANPNYFKGKIDDIRIYNNVLDSAKIDSLYHLNGWPLNQNPQFTQDSTEMTDTAMVGIEYKDTLHAIDPDGDPITFNFIDSVAGMTLTDSIISWTPAKADTGRHNIKAQVSDNKMAFDTLSWNITVINKFILATDSAGFMYPYAYQPALVMNNKLWLIGQEQLFKWKNDVWSSDDGKNWTKVLDSIPFMGRDNYACVSFQDKLWIIGGSQNGDFKQNDVWHSSDGVTWTSATLEASFSKRHRHVALAFDNKLWVISGDANNDVWYSLDGVAWTEATSSAGFAERNMATGIVFNNKMWIIGGSLSGEYYNDVWNSSDGINWVETTNSAEFVKRRYAAGTSYKNKIWISSGSSQAGPLNDVWFSEDGENWVELADDAEFSKRVWSSMLNFDNKLWIIGGVISDNSLNDVWYLDINISHGDGLFLNK